MISKKTKIPDRQNTKTMLIRTINTNNTTTTKSGSCGVEAIQRKHHSHGQRESCGSI